VSRELFLDEYPAAIEFQKSEVDRLRILASSFATYNETTIERYDLAVKKLAQLKYEYNMRQKINAP